MRNLLSLLNSGASPVPEPFALDEKSVENALRDFVLQKDYPCIAALRSLHQNESRVGIFRDFGSGRSGPALREALARFLQEQRETDSDYLSFWAIYDGERKFTEEEFEQRLWMELSSLSSEEQKEADWGRHDSNPESRQFSFCLFGEPFFVVGLFPGSSRRGRRFGRPALIFNVFRQFESLQEKGAYFPMVRTNRRRDERFDGSVNPMAEKYGEDWEAIQFSGKKNNDGWKCPFRFLHKK